VRAQIGARIETSAKLDRIVGVAITRRTATLICGVAQMRLASVRASDVPATPTFLQRASVIGHVGA